MSNVVKNPNEEKKGVSFLALFLSFIKINLFGFKILKDYFMYRKLAAMIKKEPFLQETAKKHKVAAVVFIIIHTLVFATPVVLFSRIDFTENVDSLVRSTKFGDRIYKKTKWVRTIDDKVSKYVSTFQKRKKGRNLILLSLVVVAIHSAMMFSYTTTHPVSENSKKLKKALIEEGIHQEGDGRLCITLDCGYYIDIAGHGAKEIATRESLWKRLSVTIDDLKQYETPGENTKVFFVRKFILKDTYDFSA